MTQHEKDILKDVIYRELKRELGLLNRRIDDLVVFISDNITIQDCRITKLEVILNKEGK